MPKFKNLVNFSDSKPLKGDKKHFSHEIRLFKKIKNQKNWYFKHREEMGTCLTVSYNRGFPVSDSSTAKLGTRWIP